jgi:ATP-dependent DNA ligase
METQVSVYKTLEQVAATSSKNEKEAILKRHAHDLDLQAFFLNALSPMVQFYIKKIPDYTPAKNPTTNLFTVMSDVLPKFSTRKVTGHAAIALLRTTLESLSKDDAIALERIIKKDPRCGAQTSTVNKVWKKLIPEYPVMLATAYDEKLVSTFKFPAYAQLKMDGMRFNAIVRKDKVEYRTRNGKELDLLQVLDDAFIVMAEEAGLGMTKSMVFDGELTVFQNGKIAPRQIGNGILSKAQKGTLSIQEALTIHATVWDLVPLDRWEIGFWDMPYANRYAMLQKIALGNVHAVTNHLVENLDEAQAVFNDYLAKGEEGIILKSSTMPWEGKRSKSQIKFKAENDCDLVCVDWVEGRKGTKTEGLLGALTCQTRDGKLTVNVGGGFTDEQRRTLKKKDVVGKIIAVMYNMKIVDSAGNNSLFLPRFIEIRIDKDEADAFKDIK